jgi:signal transduction histidine kinase
MISTTTSPFPMDRPAQAFASPSRFHAPEEWLAHRDGAVFPAEIRVSPMWAHGGVHVGTVLTFHDISDRREIDRIRQLDRMKDEFISTVSHELRTPLTSMRGALGLLQSGMLGSVPEKGERMLQIAVSNTDRLVRLINDILDVERLDSGRAELQRKPVDVRRLMEQALEVMQPMADEAGVTLRIRPHAGTIFVDEDRLLQVLTNLLSNAIKFSPADSTIVVSAEPADDSLCFTVQDQGRGIPSDKLEMIFERFRQVDASDARDKGGSGLGLSICRSIVQQHGGTIRAERGPGGGTLFCFTIPLREHAPVIEQRQDAVAAAVRRGLRDARPAR